MVGLPHRGLPSMFAMNAASRRAMQGGFGRPCLPARRFAAQREQGGGLTLPIRRATDALTMRALALRPPPLQRRWRQRQRGQLLIPAAKARCTDAWRLPSASRCGGMLHRGTGAAQWVLTRIAPIYEGTNGIQP